MTDKDVMCAEEEKKFNALVAKKRKIKYLYVHGKITREEFNKRLDKLEKEVDDLEDFYNKHEET